MKIKYALPTIMLCLVGLFFLLKSPIYADSVTPSIYEKSMLSTAKVEGQLTYINDSDSSVTITPVASAYDPETEQLITDTKNMFLTLDKETYTVKAQGTLTLKYQIDPADNLDPGTYFNIIILQKTFSSGYTTEKNTTGATNILSQLVAIHIFKTEDSGTGYQIEGNYAQVTMEVVNPGIPFLVPLQVKYTYQNTSNYVLEPSGEIQVFDSKSSAAPSYTSINTTEKKLYPGGTIEETVTINQWNIPDILFGRKIVGRFYNGIDQNSQIKELSLNSYYVYLGILLTIVLLVIILIKSIQKDRKK